MLARGKLGSGTDSETTALGSVASLVGAVGGGTAQSEKRITQLGHKSKTGDGLYLIANLESQGILLILYGTCVGIADIPIQHICGRQAEGVGQLHIDILKRATCKGCDTCERPCIHSCSKIKLVFLHIRYMLHLDGIVDLGVTRNHILFFNGIISPASDINKKRARIELHLRTIGHLALSRHDYCIARHCVDTYISLIRHRGSNDDGVGLPWLHLDGGESALGIVLARLYYILALVKLGVPYTHTLLLVVIPNLGIVVNTYAHLNEVAGHVLHLQSDICVGFLGDVDILFANHSSHLRLDVVLAIEHIVVGNGSDANTIAINKEGGSSYARRDVAITSHPGVEQHLIRTTANNGFGVVVITQNTIRGMRNRYFLGTLGYIHPNLARMILHIAHNTKRTTVEGISLAWCYHSDKCGSASVEVNP